MEPRGIEPAVTSAPIVANSRSKNAVRATQDDSKQREVSASVEPSIAEIERAIVEATLRGRLALAELLADRLRARLAGQSGAVAKLRVKR